MDKVWEIIAPYIAALGGATGASAIIYLILRLLMGRFTTKAATKLQATYDIDTVSQKVAERLAGKTLNIDVTAITEKALKELAKQLDKRVANIEEATNALKGILVSIAKGIIKLKALTEAERAELATNIKLLESTYMPLEKDEIMTVMLEPVELPTTNKERVDNEKQSEGVNFGNLEG